MLSAPHLVLLDVEGVGRLAVLPGVGLDIDWEADDGLEVMVAVRGIVVYVAALAP